MPQLYIDPLPVTGGTGGGDASAANQTSVQTVIATPTVAPTKTNLVSGKSNDATAQYQPIPEGAGGRSVIVEGVAGGTAQPVSLATAPSLVAGEAHIGEIAGNVISKSVTFNRPVATTQYTAKDALNVDVPITGATNASPIVVTAVAHGLADGDYVTISNVAGNTNANGSYYAKVTTYTADTFALYTDKALTTARAGNSNWTSGGDVARLFRLKGIFRKAGGDGYITRVRVAVNSATALLGDNLRIHFYRAPLAVVLDNLAYPVLWTNIAIRCGYINMPALITEGSGSDMAYTLAVPGSVDANSAPCNLPLHVENGETPADTDLYFRIEELSTGTPAANQPIFVEISVDNN